MPDGEGEVLVDFGVTPVRVDPQGTAEVVWAERICPTRARVLNVPTPESGRRFGEIVVHDGAPNGEREVDGQSYPVFDELLLWRESPLPTCTVRITAPDPPTCTTWWRSSRIGGTASNRRAGCG
ncbi:hypothetical protein NCC78_10215 [Micromonospora phytophila]|nr:hypothetical protein [Micromonospora phytophila]